MARPVARHGHGREVRPCYDHPTSVQVARLNQPRRFRVCVTGAKPAGLGAKVITEDAEIVIPVGYCGEFDARQVTVVPATALGSTQQVRGYHEIVG